MEGRADRYLLKIRPPTPLYAELHPGMSYESDTMPGDLAELGYQTGPGNLIGLPGQSVES